MRHDLQAPRKEVRLIPDYAKEDFMTPAPYEAIVAIKDNFQRQRAIIEMAEYADKMFGFKSFRKMLTEYEKSLKQQSGTIYALSVTTFTGQPIELEAGEWRADDFGVTGYTGNFEVIACCHPVMPTERLVNIDTGVEKLKIAYSKGRKWREVIADKKTLASANSIVSLADMGIAVTSENAKYMVKYLSDIENLNYDRIPERKSVSRLGMIEGEGFSPFVDGLIFDGDANFRSIFESIKTHGHRQKWLDLALKIRQGNVMARIVLAASFASVLVSPTGSLPFFVHLWGGESGTGKTVALMLAASVWGSPEMGRYIQSFNSTVVGREKLASFLNHLPLLVDELQLAKDNRGKMQFDVYALAEGVGRTRGTKTGGIDKTPTWSNCIITTGEAPITTAGAGAGAINRVIEIECRATEKIINNGHDVATELMRNYGFAGREFVIELYTDDHKDRAMALYKTAFQALSDNDTTEKQAMAAATIIVADILATEWIFKDNRALTINEISEFLQSKAAVSSGDRGYHYILDWIAQNSNKFRQIDQGDMYGVLDGGWAYIIKSVFCRAAEDGGYSPVALLSYLKQQDLIQTRGRNNTKGKRIGGVLTECVALRLASEIDENTGEEEELPF